MMHEETVFHRAVSSKSKTLLWIKLCLIGMICSGSLQACTDNLPFDEAPDPSGSTGKYTRQAIQKMKGFWEEKDSLLQAHRISDSLFIALSTDSAWSLTEEKSIRLRQLRDGVSMPDSTTLLAKFISLNDIATYTENRYGGTVGGFVVEAADVKSLTDLEKVYRGMRLDYTGSDFSPDASGYAVLRFYSRYASRLQIPYCPELGGEQEHAWPNGGGGFTTSTLGYGGFPEWRFDGYYAPKEGAELYEMNTKGKETLRAVYREGRWQEVE